jgi:RNA polymerase sigma-70 factor (ECF subfamily)
MNKRNDEQFLETLEQNKKTILRICRVYASNKQDQEDLFGEVVFQLWKSMTSFREDAHINTWFYRVTLHVCMRHALKLNKTDKKKLKLEGIQFEHPDPDAQQQMEKEEKTAQLYSCIALLPEPDKSVILLFLEDLSYKQIFHITGISENNVAQKINRIKKKLFGCLTQKGI